VINPQYNAPQHELNVISSMLRDRFVPYNQFVDWNAIPPKYWLEAHHFQTPWLSRIYQTLLGGGLDDIEQRLQYGAGDPALVTADVLTERLMLNLQQEALVGVPGAWEAFNDPGYRSSIHDAVYRLAHPSWPAVPQHARHDAYVTVRAAQHPSPTDGVPFELARGRAYDADAREKELAVIGVILDQPSRALQFRYDPSDPSVSPYWLQPQDFGDSAIAEIWDALVTGPDPAIALPAATDSSLTSEQRTRAMIEHIYGRLSYNDSHRAAADLDAQARLADGTLEKVARCLVEASRPGYYPDPHNAALYAAHFILVPSIPDVVDALAGSVRRDGLADASLYQVAAQLSTHENALNQLAERLNNAPNPLAGYDTADPALAPAQAPEGSPGYQSRFDERKVLLSLMCEPRRLHEPGPLNALTEEDFTQPEHRYYFKALHLLRFDEPAARDPWLLTSQARQLAAHDGAPLDGDEMRNIAFLARTSLPAPENTAAERLMVMTVRRTVRDGTSAVAAAAKQHWTDPSRLVGYAQTKTRQAAAQLIL
jgi:hypothetical protein